MTIIKCNNAVKVIGIRSNAGTVEQLLQLVKSIEKTGTIITRQGDVINY